MSEVVGTPQVSSDDIVIALMGVTGSGKSTFINRLVETDVGVGHKLQSCTSEVAFYRFRHSSGKVIHLIDTPGFDDTNVSDTEILQKVAGELLGLYKKQVKLSGIIYLHRITDMRMGGSTIKNIRMFKSLCGEHFYKNVVLATTMWGNLSGPGLFLETGREREQQLVNTKEWWGLMKERGSKVFRHTDDVPSALAIVDYLVRRNRPMNLKIQREMADEKKDLLETAAGQTVSEELKDAQAKWSEQMDTLRVSQAEALKDKDHELTQMLKEEAERTQKRIDQARQDQQDLKISMDKLVQQTEARHTAQINALRAAMEKKDNEFAAAREQDKAERAADREEYRAERAAERARNDRRDKEQQRLQQEERRKHEQALKQQREERAREMADERARSDLREKQQQRWFAEQQQAQQRQSAEKQEALERQLGEQQAQQRRLAEEQQAQQRRLAEEQQAQQRRWEQEERQRQEEIAAVRKEAAAISANHRDTEASIAAMKKESRSRKKRDKKRIEALEAQLAERAATASTATDITHIPTVGTPSLAGSHRSYRTHRSASSHRSAASHASNTSLHSAVSMASAGAIAGAAVLGPIGAFAGAVGGFAYGAMMGDRR